MKYDAVIAGAGPGGATAAAFMAEAGLRVLLVDKARFPRDKVCGDAISGKSVDVLRQLGLTRPLIDAGAQDAWGITFGAPSGEAASIPFTRDLDRAVPPTFVCRRDVFDQVVLDRALAAGAELWDGTAVAGLLRDGDRITGVRLTAPGDAPKSSNRRLESPLVIGADGAYSAVVRGLGLPQLAPRYYAAAVRAYYEGVTGFEDRPFMEIHFVDEALPGYFWIFPLGGGRANVGVGMLSHALKRSGKRLKALLDVCVRHERFAGRFAHARRVGPVKGWGLPLGSRPRPMAGAGWLLLGDAASLIDPFTGEGIGNAMVGGREAARWAAAATAQNDYSAAFLEGFERDMLGYLRSELRLSHAMQRLTGWTALLDFVVRRAARSPEVADALSCMFDDEAQRRRLLSPLFYLRLLRPA
ncbi:MAG: geranylgeranyl reductase family protein [Rhodothermales bacterium]|nr:geranylgeranyl reductase family protein [Rhodothermales bacterium]